MGCQGWSAKIAPQGSLSLCMIVRDEEELLPKCLASVRGLVDEIIIVDTGSQDTTIAIAQAAGAQVSFFTWIEDFAQARNASLQQATGEWILILDADEVVTDEFRQQLPEVLRSKEPIAYEVICESSHDGGVSYGPVLRLFRNLAGVHYTRPYHEQVIFPVNGAIGYEPLLRIRHQGYEPERFRQRQKLERGLRIMTRYLMDHPEDHYLRLKVAGLLAAAANDQPQALAQARQALQGFHQNLAIYHPYILFEAHYICGKAQLSLGYFEQARHELDLALSLPLPAQQTLESLIALIEIALHQQDFEQIRLLCAQGIAIDPGRYHWSMFLGWLAWLDEHDAVGAELLLQQACSLAPKQAEPWSVLGRIYQHQGASQQAQHCLEKAATLDLEHPDHQFRLGCIYAQRQRLVLAQKAFKQALVLAAKHPELWSRVRDDSQMALAQIYQRWDFYYAQELEPPVMQGCFDRVTAFLLDRNLSVLDLGCGMGVLGQYLVDVIPAYLGVDNSSQALAKLHLWQLPSLQADLQVPLPLADATWECIVLSHVLEYLPQAHTVLQEAARVLKPGGWLIVATHSGIPLSHGPKPYRAYDEETLTSLLSEISSEERLWFCSFQELVTTVEGDVVTFPTLLLFAQKS